MSRFADAIGGAASRAGTRGGFTTGTVRRRIEQPGGTTIYYVDKRPMMNCSGQVLADGAVVVYWSGEVPFIIGVPEST